MTTAPIRITVELSAGELERLKVYRDTVSLRQIEQGKAERWMSLEAAAAYALRQALMGREAA